MAGRECDELVELGRDASQVGAGDANQLVDRAGSKPQTADSDLAFDPGAQVSSLDRGVEDDRSTPRLHGGEHRVALGNTDVRDQAEDGGRRQLAENRHQPFRRIGSSSLRRSGQLRRVSEQERTLGIEERHLGDRVPELGEPSRGVEHLHVELRRPGALTPLLHRSIHQEALVSVDERQLLHGRNHGHRRSIASPGQVARWSPVGPPV